MKKTALLLGMLALMFPVPIIRSDGTPRHFFKVNLADDYPIRLSPRIDFVPIPIVNQSDYCPEECFDVRRSVWVLETLSLHKNFLFSIDPTFIFEPN